MMKSHHQNVGQYHYIKMANMSFDNLAKLKYLGTTVTNQNMIQEKTERLKSGNACYNSFLNLSPSCLRKNVKEFGGLVVTCSPLQITFKGSSQAKVDL